LDYKSITIASCWITVLVISTVYMFLFAEKIGDIIFGLFLPVGMLVLVAAAITIYVISKPTQTLK
jgi:hypothetical protein